MVLKVIASFVIALVLSTNVKAQVITQNFSMTADSGIYAGTTGVGTFTYDTVNIFADGWSQGGYSIRREEGLQIEITVFGQTFTEDNEIGIGLGDIAVPVVFFNSNYDVLGIDFAVSELLYVENGLFSTVTEISQPLVKEITFISDLTLESNGSYSGTMGISTVPIPAAVWLFGSGIISLISIARRKKS